MKPLVLVSLCFFLIIGTNAEASAHSDLDGSAANANEFTDKMLKYLGPWMVRNALDPFFVKSIYEEFWFQWLFQNHTGNIYLHDGWVQDISTMYRYEDAYLIYNNSTLTVVASVEIHDIVGNFNFRASLLNMKPTGELEAKITKQAVFLRLTFDLRTCKITLTEFILDNNGEVNIKIHDDGILGIFDGLVNVIVKALQKKFQEKVVTALGEQLHVLIQEKLDELPLLPICPPTAGDLKNLNLSDVFRKISF